MTDRLYYHDSFLYDFDAEVHEVLDNPRPALVLDRSAFYPTSGGQVFDTGWITAGGDAKFRVTEVADREDGKVVHYVEATRDFDKAGIKPGTRVHGQIDATRRRDHMQQHSGQHVLSAAFIRLFDLHTASFHMADDYCSIDLDTPTLTKEQIESAERLANEIILENRAVDIRDVDVSACGGTHVRQTGQIGCILLRKAERVRQGWRVEFVAGQRAVATARRDFTTLTEAAGLFSAHIYDVPTQARKALEEIRSLRKQREQTLEELAAAQAVTLLAETEEKNQRKLIVRTFADRELNYIKLLAQKLTRLAPNVVALLATTSPQVALVFAQSAGQSADQSLDMGALMKETLATLGGKGGGSKDMALGGAPSAEGVDVALKGVAGRLG